MCVCVCVMEGVEKCVCVGGGGGGGGCAHSQIHICALYNLKNVCVCGHLIPQLPTPMCEREN